MINKRSIAVHDPYCLLEIINRYPLATVISHLPGSMEISHLPIAVEFSSNRKIILQGHLSTRNPQWHHFKSGATLTLVFNGPNAFINSNWYKVNDVSTWNYISVQAQGLPVLEESYEGLIRILKATTNMTNRLYKDQWDFHIPDDLKTETSLTNAIGGFYLEPEKLSGKFKLSQSKSHEDQKNIINELSLRDDENSRLIAHFMNENFE